MPGGIGIDPVLSLGAGREMHVTPEDLTPILGAWPQLADGSATLINLSENHTFRIDTPGGGQYALRVHRPGYQNRQAIESELLWIEALGRDTDLLLPEPVRGADGAFVQHAADRHAVLFVYKPGREPEYDGSLPEYFEKLGEISAKCHRHVQSWESPPNFTRQTWDIPAMLAPNGLWGDWRVAPNLDASGRELLEKASQKLDALFAVYGQTPDRFGLVHADMRLANLLVHEGSIRLIDFDDSGFGWFIYDFAAAVSFFEDAPEIPHLFERWCTGYERIRPLTLADKAMMRPAILLRRLLLLAWIGSHHEVDLAREMAPNFATGTIKMAKKLLSDSKA